MQTALSMAAPSVAPTLAHAFVSPAESLLSSGRGQPFNNGWRFYKGDGPDLADVAFDDSAWRPLDLPHDWSIEDLQPGPSAVNAVVRQADVVPIWSEVAQEPPKIGPFSAVAPYRFTSTGSAGGSAAAYTIGGVGWYRKRFRLPALPADARVSLGFDGVYMNAEVFVNGARVGARPYGYAPFDVELTDHLNPSGDNVVAVRVGNLGKSARSYSGSGIYRNVHLDVTGRLRFAPWGVAVITRKLDKAVASIEVQARLEGLTSDARLITRIVDANGRVVAEDRRAAAAPGPILLEVHGPAPWSPSTPVRDQAECDRHAGGQMTDHWSSAFGVRQITLDPQNGLRLNGVPIKLRGGCLRGDNGLLGSAAFDRAEERRIGLMKARGFNAVRTAHNPPSTAFLDACDRLGMLVMEELFDQWSVPKNPDDYWLYFKDWWRRDLEAVVGRDRNHPSVAIWSMGNEIAEKITPAGVEETRAFTAELRRLDPTRLITWAIDSDTNGPVVTNARGDQDETATQFLDIAGYNYKLQTYEDQHARFPNRMIVGTESFAKDVDAVWRLTAKRDYLIGDFVWSAMDYLGEPGLGRTILGDPVAGRGLPSGIVPAAPGGGGARPDYPWINAYSGDLDLIGAQKSQSLLRDVVWGVSPLEIVVQRPLPDGRAEQGGPYGWADELQSWTWPDAVGRKVRVRLYSSAERLELELNGRKVFEKTMSEADGSIAEAYLTYEPGQLTAIAFKSGKPIARRSLETAGPANSLLIVLDRPSVSPRRTDLSYATIEVVDQKGRRLPDAVHVVELGLSGPGELLAFGNANPRGVGSFQQPVAKTWRGRALAVIRPTGAAGRVVIEARSIGLASTTSPIDVA